MRLLEAFAAAYLGNAVTKPRRKLSAQGRARHCSSSEITLGKGQGAAEGCSNCTSSDARQTKRCQHRFVARSQQRNGRGGQRSSGRRKPPEVDENRSFSEQSKPPQRRHSFETKALEQLGERRRVALLSRLPTDLKISSAAMVYPNATTVKTPTATLPA
jgi:hypothetical protein